MAQRHLAKHCETIATKFNEYFTSIAQILENTNSDTDDLDVTKLQEFVNDKVPENIILASLL